MAKDKKKKQQDSYKAWSISSLAAALFGPTIARKTLTSTWRAATGKNPPANPADPDVDLWEAVLWAVASGTAVQVVRMLLSRKAADYSQKPPGPLPPPLQKGDGAKGATA